MTSEIKTKILILEDSLIERELVRTLLQQNDFEVFETDSITTAFPLLEAHQPDFIVLEEHLPDGRSSENLDRIKALAPRSNFIFVSENLDNTTLERISSESIGIFLKKPLNPKSLIEKIKEISEFRASAQKTDLSSSLDPL